MTDDSRHGLVEMEFDTEEGRRKFLQQVTAAGGIGLTSLLAGCTGGQSSQGSPQSNGGGDSTSTPEDSDGGGGGSSSNSVAFLVDYTNERWQQRWEETLIPDFQEANPDISIDLQYVGVDVGGKERLSTLIQSGNPPEIKIGANDEHIDLLLNGQHVTVGDTVSTVEENLGTQLSEGVRNQITFDDRVWEVPHGVYNGGVFAYRTDVFNQLDLSPPETWSDLLEACQAIDEDDSIEMDPIAIAGKNQGKSHLDTYTWLCTAGGGTFQWKSDAQEEAELWFDEDHVFETLEFLGQLAEYAPDPAGHGWSNVFDWWAAGRVAMHIDLNAWIIGSSAISLDSPEVAKNSNVTTMPIREGSDPIDRGWKHIDGYFMTKNADSLDAGKKFIEYLYGDVDRAAKNYTVEPTRFIPAWQSVFESDAYQNAEPFQMLDGHLLDLNKKINSEISPTLDSPNRARTPATFYTRAFHWGAKMSNAYLVQGKSLQESYDIGREILETRFEEGQEKIQDGL